MKVEIDSGEVRTVRGENKNGPWEIREQVAYADMGKRYPTEIKLRIEKGAEPFAPGAYELDVQGSVFVDGYGNLKMGTIRLKGVAKSAVRSVAG